MYYLFQKGEQFDVLSVARQDTSNVENRALSVTGNVTKHDNWRYLPHLGSLPSGKICETDSICLRLNNSVNSKRPQTRGGTAARVLCCLLHLPRQREITMYRFSPVSLLSRLAASVQQTTRVAAPRFRPSSVTFCSLCSAYHQER
ncbi:hypothetical protein Y032_0243g3507 [Ancylostoma ceylanicum]|uniref:Uncharacterized protein n=1 Tax=Ancylostoma ceylanicum TaxID=53326 RepID=A0A016SE79_9BILA|nr:hypothetical protein Y032_0243g3507 [Ancylostoma ceylanicum]